MTLALGGQRWMTSVSSRTLRAHTERPCLKKEKEGKKEGSSKKENKNQARHVQKRLLSFLPGLCSCWLPAGYLASLSTNTIHSVT